MWIITSFLDPADLEEWAVQYTTNTAAHLYLLSSSLPFAPIPRYRLQRGVMSHPRPEITLHTTTCTEQAEPGNTYLHTFFLPAATFPTTICFFLSGACAYAPGVQTGPPQQFYAEGEPVMALIAARVYNNAHITIATATTTQLPFNQQRYDTASFHNPALNPERLTVPTNGLYNIGASIGWIAGSGGERYLWIVYNGAVAICHETLGAPAPAGYEPRYTISAPWVAYAGDYFVCQVRQTSGSNKQIRYDPNASPEFWIRLIAPLP